MALARLDDAIVILGMDGAVRTLDATDGTPRTSVAIGVTPARFAVGPGGRVAVALPTGRVAIVDPRTGTLVRTLDAGEQPIVAVAWHDRTLVTGDAAGRVALWD